MTNEYIEVVKRWRAGEAISLEELRANADAAWAAYDANAYCCLPRQTAFNAHARGTLMPQGDDAAEADYVAAASAHAADAADAAAADYWVTRYEELTNEK